MNNREIVELIKVIENTEILKGWLEDEFSESQSNDDVQLNLLIQDMQKQIKRFSPVNQYDFTPDKLVIGGKTYSLSNVISNLRYAIEKLSLMQKQKTELLFNEADFPEFITDEQLMKRLNYTKATISSKRSRGELPKTNNFGLTSRAELFKMMRESTPEYLSPEEKVQQFVNKKKRRR